MPLPGAGLYAASKAAGEQFALALAKEIGHRQVRINVVLPEVNIMNYPWASGGLRFIRSAYPKRVENLTALDRWVKTIGDRPAVQKGLAVLK